MPNYRHTREGEYPEGPGGCAVADDVNVNDLEIRIATDGDLESLVETPVTGITPSVMLSSNLPARRMIVLRVPFDTVAPSTKCIISFTLCAAIVSDISVQSDEFYLLEPNRHISVSTSA